MAASGIEPILAAVFGGALARFLPRVTLMLFTAALQQRHDIKNPADRKTGGISQTVSPNAYLQDSICFSAAEMPESE
ncbi:hypothetical protein QO002_000156 [Pararhizobium capsulatum DSM 1112]|uniref:Uncharacterized protein n=1 Tax=Pararhizobium capsulatum DSM 1112 TaxID=1121113 RepID=A0ABU0BID4_9HYPH|nr:hypothetical protein [Pararhizobium capsulatum DSM 1112]